MNLAETKRGGRVRPGFVALLIALTACTPFLRGDALNPIDGLAERAAHFLKIVVSLQAESESFTGAECGCEAYGGVCGRVART